MNILVLNGSPKGDKSNTLKITKAFLDGLNADNKHHVDIISINEAHIEHCRGCFACWTKTPGQCIIEDDMAKLTEKYISAHIVLWSFPLYYFGMPSKIKAFLDRLLPTNLPYIVVNDNKTAGHPSRYDLSHQRHVLISSCGFHSTENNYDALLKQFEIILGNHFAKILCPEGELLKVPQLSIRVNEYLAHVKKAGEEFALQNGFSEETQNKLKELLYPPEVFIEMANASWQIQEPVHNNQPQDRSYNFMLQMAAVYNSQEYIKDIVIEMFFTDINKTYQLLLGKEKCTVKTDGFIPYTTKIETPFELWLGISEGKINGSEALMKKQYKVLGDFDTMMKISDYFGVKKPLLKDQSKLGKTNMNILLFQWIALWILLPINTVWGGAVGIAICSLVPLLGIKHKLTVYDRISSIMVSMLGVMALLSVNKTFILCLSYLLFSLLWLLSCATKIPLSAHYSNNYYGGEEAFSNPLFIKTNKILTLAWGILYIITAVLSYFLMNSTLSDYTGLINSTAPVLLGLFTSWFAKWYPAKVARG